MTHIIPCLSCGPFLYILHSVCTASRVLSFVSFTSPARDLNLRMQSVDILNDKMYMTISLLGNIRVAHTFVQPALAGGYDCTLRSQAGECNLSLAFVAGAYTICYDVHTVPVAEKIDCCLSNTNMRLDPNDSDM